MGPTKELIDSLYREKVLRARRPSPGEKLFLGPELFEMACEWARAGIRSQHPEADEAQVTEILRKRLALRKRMEQPR